MISKLEQLVSALINIDQRLGLRKLIKYLAVLAIVLLLIPVLKDPKGAVKETVRFFIELSVEIESDKMKERDAVIAELNPLLRELRAETGADRVVYYEYHNSIENEAGVPFRFVDLVQQAPKMGMPDAEPRSNINVSRFAELYCDLIERGAIINAMDSTFSYRYPGSSEISNGSKGQIYVNIQGMRLPLGIVVLEWYDESDDPDWETSRNNALRESLRITALMSKVSNGSKN